MWGKNGLLCLCNVYVFFISATMMCWLVWVDLLTILGEQEWMVWRQSRLYNCNCCLTGPIVSSSYIKLLPIPITCQIWFRVRPLPMYIPNGLFETIKSIWKLICHGHSLETVSLSNIQALPQIHNLRQHVVITSVDYFWTASNGNLISNILAASS